jgi:hypothetical protein
VEWEEIPGDESQDAKLGVGGSYGDVQILPLQWRNGKLERYLRVASWGRKGREGVDWSVPSFCLAEISGRSLGKEWGSMRTCNLSGACNGDLIGNELQRLDVCSRESVQEAWNAQRKREKTVRWILQEDRGDSGAEYPS